MNIATRIFYAFTPYTDARERVVDRFFKRLNEHGSKKRIRARLGRLIQRDIAAISLWTEYRYTGYRYLNKAERRKAYANLTLIAADFDAFYANRTKPGTLKPPDETELLVAIMGYLSPQRGVYQYRDSSSFGGLLRNPAEEKLTGDCNQIVTLYIYLYSRYFDVHNLQLRVLPEHVALHYDGRDIETTNGTFANYGSRKGSRLLPVEEIVSINLLDVTDSRLARNDVAARDLLQCSRLAYALSHDRDIVTHNLNAAYSRLVNSLMKRNEYGNALKTAKASHNKELTGIVSHNGAIYELKRGHYAIARRFARTAPERNRLTADIWHTEAVEQYQMQRYRDAIAAFKHAGDTVSVKRCYEALFFEEQARLGKTITASAVRNHRRTVSRMHTYAKKSGNKRLIKHAASLRAYRP